MKDLTTNQYGRLTVIKLDHTKKYKSKNNQQTKAYWLCRCACGKEKVLRGEHLTSGRTVSCGCSYHDINLKHGHSRRDTKTPEYQTWLNMRNRLSSKEPHKIKAYADVGMEERWDDFTEFLKDMGNKPNPNHELDRINPFGPYCAVNCRWATRSEQMQNTRRHY